MRPRPLFYDKHGNPINISTMGRLFEDMTYRRVDETHIAGRYWVSTIWIGFDQSFGRAPPIIFETRVFTVGEDGSLGETRDCECYATEEEAIAGHKLMVDRWMAIAEKDMPYGSRAGSTSRPEKGNSPAHDMRSKSSGARRK